MKNKFTDEYLLTLLNEAPADQANPDQQQQTTFSTTDQNATYEPQEQDASMDTGGDPNMDMGMDQGGEMDDDMGGGDPAMDGQQDPSMTGQPQVDSKDIIKKRRLFTDYKNLLEIMDNIMGVAATMLTKEVSDDARKIYRFVNEKMEENREKMSVVMTEQYLILSYQQLLTIYMYMKIATKSYSDIMHQIKTTFIDEF